RERRRLHEEARRQRRGRAQGAGLQAVRRAGRSEGQDQSDAVRDLQRREGVRGAPADAALQEVRRRSGAAARLPRALDLEAHLGVDRVQQLAQIVEVQQMQIEYWKGVTVALSLVVRAGFEKLSPEEVEALLARIEESVLQTPLTDSEMETVK